MMAKLVLKNVFKKYPNDKNNGQQNDYAVNDLSLECNDGEFIGILGPSGCGKSTTLRMIAGLESVTHGEIFIGDTVINNLHPKDRHIGLAFEDYALYPPLSVYDNVAFNLRASKFPEKDISKRINEIAPLLKIQDLLTERPGSLSGGQKQRVNIARAIIRRPQVLLLDEPLSHLDGKMRQILRAEIKRLHKQIKCTTIIVTHDQLEAMSVADRIAILKDGELQQFGTPLEIYDDPVNEFVAGFIGEPPMNLLSVEICKLGNRKYFVFPKSEIKLPVPDQYIEALEEGMIVKLGVRPTDVAISDAKNDRYKVKISVVEDFGEEKRIMIRVGGEFMTIVSTSERKYEIGDVIGLEMRAEKTHLFDLRTGERIRAL
jgi:multiple sugar transport system ATP-binding protein